MRSNVFLKVIIIVMKEKVKLNLFRFVRPLLFFFILTAVINFIFVGLDNITPQITRVLVDRVIVGKDLSIAWMLLLSYLAIGFARSIMSYTREFSCDYAGSKIGCEIRKDFFKKIQGLSANFFDRTNAGELMSRVIDDVNSIWELFTFVGMLFMEITIHVCVVLFFMWKLNWKLSLVPTCAMVLCAFVALRMNKVVGPIFGGIAEENSKLNNMVSESLQGIRTVKSFLRHEYEILKFRKLNEKYCELNSDVSMAFANFNPVFQTVRFLVPIGVLLQGGYYVMNDFMTLGELTAFIFYSMSIVWPMEMLGWLSSCVSRSIEGIKRINSIYGQIPEIVSSCESEGVCVKGNIEFRNVSFTGENGTSVLKDVSFRLGAGQTLGIMGATGSGKTTVVNLLKRMYDATGGSILLDGKNIRDMSLQDLRMNVSVVMQDVFLFSEEISGNVKLGGKKTIGDQNVDLALDDSSSSGFVSKLDDGKNTVIGERGVGLSGGQKQRLTIARALARSNSPVLILDDSTSALDTETEKKIQQMLLKKNCTKIIIGHRISSVQNADKIIVLENGQVAECGTHGELLSKKGLYYEIWHVQNDL